jgi:ketosteroid isomerase-like protein
MSKIEEAIRVVIEFNKAFNCHDVEGMVVFISDDCIFETSEPAPDGTVYSGKEEITRFWQDSFSKSSEARKDIEEIFSFGERCIMQWRYGWRDLNGNTNHVRGVDIFRVRKGFICEGLSYVKGRLGSAR